MDARLKVPVSGKHARHHQLTVTDGLLNRRIQRTAVADAGRASIADEIKAECVQTVLQSSRSEVIGHDPGTRSETGLHTILDLQPERNRVAGHQSGCDHHIRVAGVRAARNSGDHHRPIREHFLTRSTPGIDRIFPKTHRNRLSGIGFGPAKPALCNRSLQQLIEFPLEIRQVDAVLRALWARYAGHNRTEVQIEHIRVCNVALIGNAPQSLCLEIGFHQRDLRFIPAGLAQVIG